MGSHVTVLNFDQTYRKQAFLQTENCQWLDLEGIPGTNLFCEKDGLFLIEQKLKQSGINQMTFLGSGNYHYVSFLLLSVIQKPFTLVLFDHHTDMFPSPNESLISCGSWVRESVKKLPLLEKVILIGVKEDWKQQIPSAMVEKVAVYSEQSLHTSESTILKSIMDEIPTDSVYISVDKDVLDSRDAVTAWDHGTLRLQPLIGMVKEIIREKAFCGIDICGEYPITPANEYHQQTIEAVNKNEYANRVIWECLKQTCM
ncbi:hypothetical protein F3157_14815 [Virgibacillus dakarensis]|uniref:Arginase n=1 Tax=Lentibacillus populi TaxID=1827502 RepID=A0A9W5TZQ6_9BACI|nr:MULTISPECIES: arginase family protein [Bacillaceae]MBT2217014.1 arginase family protein [Virgibacillus dakarensis]MTW86921.1 hypothetical protein [Virgibacillus dakarensis]GGB52510.1 arginase [Lentibacillus populi]